MKTAQLFTYQPIVDLGYATVATELVYAGQDDRAQAAHNIANAIFDAFVHAGPVQLPRQRLTYLEVSPDLMAGDLLEQLPGEQFALVVRWQDMATMGERCRALKATGFTIALDGGGAGIEDLRPCLQCADVIRFDATSAVQQPEALFSSLRACGVRLLARGVDSAELRTALKALGFSFFQGYHFTQPKELQVQRVDPRKLDVIDLLTRISDEADDAELEATLKSEPELSFELLRIVNSSAFMLKTRIRSIKHAFSILGRAKLARWLQLLLFALGNDGQPSPLMELAMRRARFMEFVLQYRTHNPSTLIQDEAFMTGMLSLVHIELGWSIEETLNRLTLTDEISEALLRRTGTLGRLINLCEALETCDFATVIDIADELHLPIDGVMNAQNVAQSFAEHVGRDMPDDASQPAP